MGDFDGPVHKGGLDSFGTAVCSRCGETWPCDVTELREGIADLKRKLREAREKVEKLSVQVAEAVWVEDQAQRGRDEAQAQLRALQIQTHNEQNISLEQALGAATRIENLQTQLCESEATQEELATKAREEIEAHKRTHSAALSATSRLQQEVWGAEAAREGMRSDIERLRDIAHEWFEEGRLVKESLDEFCAIGAALSSPSGLCKTCGGDGRISTIEEDAIGRYGKAVSCPDCSPSGLRDALKAGYEAFDNLLQHIWANADVHPRHGYGTCERCDKAWDDSIAALKLLGQYIGGRA